MPYSSDPNLDDKDQQQQMQQAPQLASGGSIVGGASATTSPTGGAAGGTEPTHSGNFQNLNSYLDANAGSGFGSQFVGKVAGDVNAAATAQQQGAQQFKGASDAATVKEDPNVVNQALSDPYGFSQSKDNSQAFQNQANASYKGPLTYSDDAQAYQTAYGATQKAQDTANASQNEGGRFALLNNYFGTPDYNQGQKSLDNLLVQADPTTSQGLAQAKQNADKAQVSFQQQAAPLQNYAAQNVATTKATADDVTGKANTAIGGMQTEYGTALTDAQKTRMAALDGLQQAFSSGDTKRVQDVLGQYGGSIPAGPADPYTANPQGLWTGDAPTFSSPPKPDNFPSPTQNAGLGGTDHITRGPNSGIETPNDWGVLSSYKGMSGLPTFIQPTSAPNASSVLSTAQQQKLNALQGLMNETQTPFTASQAGSYDGTKPFTVDQNQIQGAQKTAAANYQTAQQQIQQNMHNIGTSTDPSLDSAQAKTNAIYAQIDQLNQIRAGYGLKPVPKLPVNFAHPV